MDELISRQEAVDEINRLVKEVPNIKIGTSTFRDGILDAYARVLGIIRSVPSAHSNTLDALDCIERQAAIDAVKEYFKFSPLEGRQCAKAIERVPSVQPIERCIVNVILNEEDLERIVKEQVEEIKELLPQKGEWIWDDDIFDLEKEYICSECRCYALKKDRNQIRSNFCPNCGCDMREGD